MKTLIKWLKIERILLLTVIALQIAILVRIASEEPESSVLQRTEEQLTQLAPDEDSISPTSSQPKAPIPAPTVHSRRIFTPARQMLDEMDSFFERAISDFERMEAVFDTHRDWETIPASPTMDMREQDNSYVVLFSLPGLSSTDVEVSLEGRLLSIATVFNHPAYRDPYGQPATLKRRVRFPGPVAGADMAQAFVTNGILTISVPKSFTEPSSDRTRLF